MSNQKDNQTKRSYGGVTLNIRQRLLDEYDNMKHEDKMKLRNLFRNDIELAMNDYYDKPHGKYIRHIKFPCDKNTKTVVDGAIIDDVTEDSYEIGATITVDKWI